MPLLRILLACLIATLPLAAQRPQNPRGAAFGHVHVSAADPAAAIAFWTDAIGAAVYTRESQDGAGLSGISMIGGLILFSRPGASGPAAGAAIERISIRVPELDRFAAKLAKSPYKTSRTEGDPATLVIDGPDGVRIELIEDSQMYATLEFDSVHLSSPQPADAQAWYSKVFGARPGADEKANTSRLQGGVLAFDKAADKAAPSAGRAIDHIAFEVKDLESFCQKLTAEGIKLDSPYHADPKAGFASAFLTDPWGVRIELTEGLSR